ncbi:MAG: LysM peptidoglycan-binding domain-containing protein [Gammaproteobacteria bacterium]|nr:LysM peptidoglycan-binding domain-containing protein [Gammaproteobacteria bacterium]
MSKTAWHIVKPHGLALAAALLAAALLSACATSGGTSTHSGPVSVPAATDALVHDPSQALAAATAGPPLLLDASDPTLRALTTPQPAVGPIADDLFDRMRRGFSLADVDQPAIDRELNWYANHPDYLERTFGRAELYLHYIVNEVYQRGMPLELALLPVVESAFEPYAYSRARAAGLWQFISGTGKLYGLKQNWWYDGRRDVVESTRAALDYLQKMHDDFGGDWLLAIAGYNCGEGNIVRAIEQNRRAGRPTDFWHLRLPVETRGYVPKLLAMRRLVKNPESYGLEFSRIPDQPYFTQIRTGGQIDLQVVADLAGITREELYELNPAFHRWATDPTGPYGLLVPIDVAAGLETALLGLTPEQRMRVEQYAVQPGDSLATIAQRFGTTPTLIRELNGMEPGDRLISSGALRVPSSHYELPEKAARAALLVDRRGGVRRGTRPVVHVVRRGDSLWGIAQRLGTDVKTLARLNNMTAGDTLRAGQKLVVSERAAAASGTSDAAPTASGSGRQVTYTVRSGDTLYSIARVLQVTVADLMDWNGLSKRSIIKPGQRLIAFIAARS